MCACPSSRVTLAGASCPGSVLGLNKYLRGSKGFPGHYPCCPRLHPCFVKAHGRFRAWAQSTHHQSRPVIHACRECYVAASLPRKDLMNRSILLYKLLWCRRVTSGDIIEVRREFVRISNINMKLFAKAPPMQASGSPRG